MGLDEKNRQIKTEICKILDRIGALKFGAFKLTSGKISPYYIDLRIVPSFPDAFQKICELTATFVKNEIGLANLDRIVGIPIAGMPIAVVLAYNFKKPFLYVRKGVRTHGRERRVEGILSPGDRILLIDDLITTGLSFQKAAKSVTAEGGVVNDAVVLIDRQEGGKKKLEKTGIKLHALLSVTEIVNTLNELGTIDEQQTKLILKQVKAK